MDHREARYQTGTSKGWRANAEEENQADATDDAAQGKDNEGLRRSTPPPDVRTDPDQGAGEMGFENVDPGQPLSADPRRPQKPDVPPVGRG